MGTPGGFTVTPGLYRVPDLLTEEQFIEYMKNNYNVEVAFTHSGEKPSAVTRRALGQSRPMGVLDENDHEGPTPTPVVDPVLAAINNMKTFDENAAEAEEAREKANKETLAAQQSSDENQGELDLLLEDPEKKPSSKRSK